MAKYKVIGPKVIIAAGFVLGLSEEQIKTRKHLVTRHGKYYKALVTMEFKKGEVIDIITKNLSKGLLSNLEIQDKSSPPPASKSGSEKNTGTKETGSETETETSKDV